MFERSGRRGEAVEKGREAVPTFHGSPFGLLPWRLPREARKSIKGTASDWQAPSTPASAVFPVHLEERLNRAVRERKGAKHRASFSTSLQSVQTVVQGHASSTEFPQIGDLVPQTPNKKHCCPKTECASTASTTGGDRVEMECQRRQVKHTGPAQKPSMQAQILSR
eukprot:1161601-Pelagomonas_calceolata.AAC.8